MIVALEVSRSCVLCMQLETATWQEVDALDSSLAIVPVGSTEQHGPHAPLGTDSLNAGSVAQAGAEKYEAQTGREIVVIPTIPIGIAEEHRSFAGTLWVSPDTFRAYLRETVASLAHHGFDRVVIVNGHGGNIDALNELTGIISRHDDAYAVGFTWFNAVGEHSTRMGHGGVLETSLLQHTYPDTIRSDQLETAAERGADRWGEWVAGVNLAHDSIEFTENGVVGEPTDASAELGVELLETATDELVSLLEAVSARTQQKR